MDYDVITNKFEEIRNEIENDIKLSNVPFTLKSLLRTSQKVDQILESIRLIKNQFYSSQILIRSLFEHYIVSHYIFMKWYNHRNDIVGLDYYQKYMISEFIKQTSYNYQIDNIEKNGSGSIPLDELRKFKSLQDATHADIQEMHMVGNQFEIKRIGKYFISLNVESYALKGVHRAMLDFMRRYNKLSSWVHGGPTADIITFEKELHLDLEITEENIKWSEIASKSIKFNIMSIMAFEFSEKYVDHINDVVGKKR